MLSVNASLDISGYYLPPFTYLYWESFLLPLYYMHDSSQTASWLLANNKLGFHLDVSLLKVVSREVV